MQWVSWSDLNDELRYHPSAGVGGQRLLVLQLILVC
ncbi:hypothetical protein PSEUDO8Z_180113 [Pseudomonas sp. 8Z]|nr:hypothetical protein PSEUDO8Z_180113 [Pseudomonas sp. 8Z]